MNKSLPTKRDVVAHILAHNETSQEFILTHASQGLMLLNKAQLTRILVDIETRGKTTVEGYL